MPSLDGVVRSRGARNPFELRMLTGLPCGCVVADFQAVTIDVGLVSIEAKGPHCSLHDHSSGHILAIGDRTGDEASPLDPLVVEAPAA